MILILLAAGEKPVRDKAVASLSRFLAGTKKAHGNDDELTVGDLDWNSDYTLDSRLAPNEMAKLWKGVFFCTSGLGLRRRGGKGGGADV